MRRDYRAKVGSPHALNKNGPLRGIQHGADLIERLQPYKCEGDPHADPLWHIHRFSNADKHRQIAATLPLLGAGSIRIAHGSTIIGRWQPDELPLWTAEQEYEVGRLQFAPPYPLASQFGVEGKVAAEVAFGTAPIRRRSRDMRSNCRSSASAVTTSPPCLIASAGFESYKAARHRGRAVGRHSRRPDCQFGFHRNHAVARRSAATSSNRGRRPRDGLLAGVGRPAFADNIAKRGSISRP